MTKLNIFFGHDTTYSNGKLIVKTDEKTIKVGLNTFGLNPYELTKQIMKLNKVFNIYESIKHINIIFDKELNTYLINLIITRLSDILYKYKTESIPIKCYQVTEESINLMNELTLYKDIVMDPNKTPQTYLDYVKSRIPSNYKTNVYDLSNDKNLFPLTQAVGLGSQHKAFFVHIEPSNPKLNNKTIFLVGKAITYDSGGLNIKTQKMEDMKVDMTGSAMLLSVLVLINKGKLDDNLNIHLLIPIVENMIGNNAIKPGMVVNTMNRKKVEINNTDAEGRLCLADCLEYICIKLAKELDHSKCLIIDTATLTGNTTYITSGVSSLIMGNKFAQPYLDIISKYGDEFGEYMDQLKLREEYFDSLKSPVADIRNVSMELKAGCVVAGAFLNYFVKPTIPWVHIDLGNGTFVDSVARSHGVNTIYHTLKHIAIESATI